MHCQDVACIVQKLKKNLVTTSHLCYNQIMTTALQIDQNVYDALVASFGKDALETRIDNILLSAMEGLLEKHVKAILMFEEKYGVSFPEFDKMWDEGRIPDKNTHAVESDYIDWEMLEMEKKDLLPVVSRLRTLLRK